MKKLSKKLTSKWSLKSPLYVEKNDERYNKYATQLKENGFSDTETWALDSVISEFILPRLKRFKEVTNGYPSELTIEKWNDILDIMIFAFEWNLTHEVRSDTLSEEEQRIMWKKHEKGMELFATHFRDLWW